VFHNTQSNSQKFVQGAEKIDRITAIALSPNKKFIAVAESGEHPQIEIFDTNTNTNTTKRRKVLNVPDLGSDCFTCMAFSAEGRYLVTQGGAPEWNLVYWHWERSRYLAKLSIATEKQVRDTPDAVTQCSINPQEPPHMCISGNGVFKFFRYMDGLIKPATGGMGKVDAQNFKCHAWLPGNRLIVSTDNGDLLLVEDSEFKCLLPLSPSDGVSIDMIIPTSKGFICGGAMGIVHIFAQTDEKEMYKKLKTIRLDHMRVKESALPPSSQSENLISGALHSADEETVSVRSFALTPLEDVLAISTSTNQIYGLNINVDWSKNDEVVFQTLAEPFHSGPVLGLDTCVRKPLVVTSGKDRTIRVWNTMSHRLEVVKTFATEAYSVSMHPSGLHILAGFQDRLRFMNLYGDDIREFKAFQIRQCMECKFSIGGQYFAAVNVNAIQIYNTYTCDAQPIGTLRGHNQRVKSMYWCGISQLPTDTRLVSCGYDGSIYDWNIKEMRKEDDHTDKKYTYHACVADDKMVWVVGAHTQENKKPVRMREMDLNSLHGDSASSDYDCNESAPTCLALGSQHRMLLAGCEDGCVRVYAFPMQGGINESIMAHCGPVARICLTYDESMLYTIGDDGVLFIYDVKEKENRTSKREITFSEEILISKNDLEDKNFMIQNLKAKAEELKVDMDFQDKRRHIKHDEKTRDLADVFRVDSLKQAQQFEALWNAHLDQEKNFAEIKRDTMEKHKTDCGKFEQEYLAQLRALDQQIQSCKAAFESNKAEFMKKLRAKDEDLEQKSRLEEEQLAERLSEEKETASMNRKRLKETLAEQKEMRTQLEMDTDAEIEDMKRNNDKTIDSKREEYLRLKGENGITKNKFATLQKDIEEKTAEALALEKETQSLQLEIMNQQNRSQSLRDEIRQRDDTIGDKEHQIYELKKQNQELEKYKFVLDHKIRVLKSQIEPKAKQILQAKKTIKDMDAELEHFHHNNLELDDTITALKKEIDSRQTDIHTLKNRLKDSETYRSRVRTDFCELASLVQDPDALRVAVDKLYAKHIASTEGVRVIELPESMKSEYERQKNYLDKTVESLRRKLVHNSDQHRVNLTQTMSENVTLIQEIAELRREIKALRTNPSESTGNTTPTPHESKAGGTVSQLSSAAENDILLEIENNRIEIGRLKEMAGDLEASLKALMARPVSRDHTTSELDQ
jgi:WD40 repeat protein